MSTILRTLRNLRRVGIRDALHQMHYQGDTKAGTLIGTDRYGNKYFENLEEELPLRTRWVDYKDDALDAAQIEPGWHAWMSYMVDKPPTQDPILHSKVRPWERPGHTPNMTQTQGAFRTYNTVKPKITAWTPNASTRA